MIVVSDAEMIRTRRACWLEAVWSIQDGQERLVIHYDQTTRSVSNSANISCTKRRVNLRKLNGHARHAPSLGALAIISATSACVGFCPSARSRSPRTSRGTAPVPFLSNSANASLYSATRPSGENEPPCIHERAPRRIWHTHLRCHSALRQSCPVTRGKRSTYHVL